MSKNKILILLCLAFFFISCQLKKRVTETEQFSIEYDVYRSISTYGDSGYFEQQKIIERGRYSFTNDIFIVENQRCTAVFSNDTLFISYKVAPYFNAIKLVSKDAITTFYDPVYNFLPLLTKHRNDSVIDVRIDETEFIYKKHILNDASLLSSVIANKYPKQTMTADSIVTIKFNTTPTHNSFDINGFKDSIKKQYLNFGDSRPQMLY